MRIGFDLSITKLNQAGTSVYAQNLFAALKRLIETEHNRSFSLHPFNIAVKRDMQHRQSWLRKLTTIYADVLYMHAILPAMAMSKRVDLIHMPANTIPLFCTFKSSVFVHDTTIFDHPEHFTTWHRNYARFFTRHAVQNATHILTNSQQSKQDILRWFDVPASKVTITTLAANPAFMPLPASALDHYRSAFPKNFILTVGALEPRKNITRLIHAYANYRKEGGALPLLHVGPRGWNYKNVLSTVEELGLKPHIQFLGHVEIDTLVALYNLAEVFVYPSLYEGFGLPIVEAMSCGCPVITSNTSSMPEVGGSAVVYVDPTDTNSIMQAMQSVLQNDPQRQMMRTASLSQSRRFSWEMCARETLACFEYINSL